MTESVGTADSQSLTEEIQQLRGQVAQLQQQLDWFKRQLFGQKSEKRNVIDPAVQADLLSPSSASSEPPVAVPKETVTYTRGKKQRTPETVTDKGLRFDASVPVRVIELPPEGVNDLDDSEYERISEKVTYRLAQKPADYEVVKIVRPVLKRKADQQLICASAAPQVLERSFADVSFLAGMLIDKFIYHLPLYRQHQRLADSGITLSRGSLTQLAKRTIELLRPIYDAQFKQVLLSKVLALDETPIKAGRQKQRKGKLKQAYFWPIYGDADEMVFPFSLSKSYAALEQLLEGWQPGTLLSDGASVYEKYAAQRDAVVHAECWAHTRREFERAKEVNPKESAEALALIGELYRQEAEIRRLELVDEAKHVHRIEHSLPAVNRFFTWCDEQIQRGWSSVDRIGKALNYATERRSSLEVFLADPAVPIDTNHLERSLRVIPMGRKNWMFCWTELGAEHVGIIQSLLVTCRLQGLRPYTYLVDVLQRVDRHPASQVEELTPRIWKETFARNPLKSIIDT